MPGKQKQISKFIGIPLAKGFDHDSEGHLVARGFFTSDKVDALGDIITKEATERAVDAYRQWGNIRYMHQPRPVGKVVGIGKADGLKWNEVEFKVVDKDAAYEVEQGLLSAMSVGILVNWDDIELMEEGGFKILDYQLAEISLVDHPANYDATLKGVEATEGLRYLAREYGFEVVAREMASLLNIQMEGNMPKKVEKDIVEEEVIESEDETIEETQELIEDDEVPAEAEEVEAPAEADEVEVEKDLEAETEEAPAEADVEEETEEEETPAPDVEEEEELSIEASITEAFTSGFAKLFEVLEAQNTKLDLLLASLETPAEDHGSDQTEGEDEEPEEEEVERSLDEEDEEKSAAVDRSGQIAPTDTMDLSDEDEETPGREDLKSSLYRFFGVNQEV